MFNNASSESVNLAMISISCLSPIILSNRFNTKISSSTNTALIIVLLLLLLNRNRTIHLCSIVSCIEVQFYIIYITHSRINIQQADAISLWRNQAAAFPILNRFNLFYIHAFPVIFYADIQCLLLFLDRKLHLTAIFPFKYAVSNRILNKRFNDER